MLTGAPAVLMNGPSHRRSSKVKQPMVRGPTRSLKICTKAVETPLVIAAALTDASVLPIAASAVGGVVTGIGATFLAKYLDNRSERRQWRRNRTAKACRKFLVAAERTFSEIQQNVPDRAKCLQLFDMMTEAGSVVDVFAEALIARRTRDVWNIFDEWLFYQWKELNDPSSGIWQDEQQRCRQKLDELITYVRRSLNEDEIPKKPADERPHTGIWAGRNPIASEATPDLSRVGSGG